MLRARRKAGPPDAWRAAGLAAGVLAALWLAGCGEDEEGGGPDTTAPVITSGPTVTDLSTGAVRIVWTTDEAANSVLRYGPDTTTVYLATDPTLATAHSVGLRTGLVPDSTVCFRVESTDASSNTVRSAVDSFVVPHPSLAFAPDTVEAGGGESFTVDLTAGAVTDLFGAAVAVLYDPALLTCDSVKAGAFLRGVSDTVIAAAHTDSLLGEASIGLTRVRPAAGRDGSGVLATLYFRARAAGTSALTVRESDLALRDPDGADMVNLDELVLDAGTVIITTR